MFFIACAKGFVKDYNGRLIFTVNIRNAKPFLSHNEAYQFSQTTALNNHYFAILSSEGPYNVETRFEALNSDDQVIGSLTTDDMEEGEVWVESMKRYENCALIIKLTEYEDIYLERIIWSNENV